MKKKSRASSHLPLRVKDILKELEKRAPAEVAEDWDNVGLLVGDRDAKITGVVVSIDLTENAIETALKKKCNLIVNHHPCIFPKSRGISRVTSDSLVYRALTAGISVIASHTNFDQCALEVVHAVSHALGVRAKGRLLDRPSEALLKLVVTVPHAFAEQVKEALCDAGAGKISNYDRCSFISEGEGTFRGSVSSRPFIGEPGKVERVAESRLEVILPRGLKSTVLSALLKAHPYEEVAYDFYAVEQKAPTSGLVSGLGYGFWGKLEKPKAFSEVMKTVKLNFNVQGFWLTESGSPTDDRQIKKVAFVAGKGSSFISAAHELGCDLFITGEAGYHDALRGSRRGMAVMELGHRESEKFFLTTMEGWLTEMDLKVISLNQPTQRICT